MKELADKEYTDMVCVEELGTKIQVLQEELKKIMHGTGQNCLFQETISGQRNGIIQFMKKIRLNQAWIDSQDKIKLLEMDMSA